MNASEHRIYHNTNYGHVFLGDSLDVMSKEIRDDSVSLVVTSPPYGLVRKKDYGNADADDYIDWFRPFAAEFKRILKKSGSLVIDIGGAWVPGQPTRSLYHFELLLMLCKEFGFHLAQEFFWWNPSKLPTPAEWVTVRRIRAKDAVDTVWWLSLTPWPQADNRRILQPYSDSMKTLLRDGYNAKMRPSGHDISTKFGTNNRASIPPNLLAIANTESNSHYLRYCKENGIKPNPARFPSDLPEFFVRFLTDPGDLVFDPFAGSCVTGEVCEKLERPWICSEIVEEYLQGALARFDTESSPNSTHQSATRYGIWKPGALWDELEEEELSEDGGKERRKRTVRFKNTDNDEHH